MCLLFNPCRHSRFTRYAIVQFTQILETLEFLSGWQASHDVIVKETKSGNVTPQSLFAGQCTEIGKF